MVSSLLISSALVAVLVGSSSQQMVPPVSRAPQWAGGSPGFPGYQGYRGVQGYPGSGDAGYGFQIVDAPDRYGYVSTYPGGRTSFFLLGPNRGPGQQSWRGSTVGPVGSPQLGSYRPDVYRPDVYRQGTYRQGPGTYRAGTFPAEINTNMLGG